HYSRDATLRPRFTSRPQSLGRAIVLPVRLRFHLLVDPLQHRVALVDEVVDAAALGNLDPAEEAVFACVVVALGRADATRPAMLEAALLARTRRQGAAAAPAQARPADRPGRYRSTCSALGLPVHDITIRRFFAADRY